MDVVSREDAIEAVNNLSDVFVDGKPPLKYATEVQDAINGLPTVEERKIGKWEEIAVIDAYDIYGVLTWASKLRCTQCGFIHTTIEGHMAQYMYCPSCGARMDGGRG